MENRTGSAIEGALAWPEGKAGKPVNGRIDRADVTAQKIDAHVGRRLRERREALGISQGRLGRDIGLTFSQVQKYEKGTNRIGAGRLFLLARLMGVTVEYFFEGIEDASASIGALGRAVAVDADLVALRRAFCAIADPEARRAVVALVLSLSGSSGAADRPVRIGG